MAINHDHVVTLAFSLYENINIDSVASLSDQADY